MRHGFDEAVQINEAAKLPADRERCGPGCSHLTQTDHAIERDRRAAVRLRAQVDATVVSVGSVPTGNDTAITGAGPGAVGRLAADDTWVWVDGDTVVALTDIGDGGAGPRAQLVTYGRLFGPGETTHAVSAELTPDEARTLAFSLLGWADEATGNAPDGTSGQDRKSYTDTQDRESYTVDPVLPVDGIDSEYDR